MIISSNCDVSLMGFTLKADPSPNFTSGCMYAKKRHVAGDPSGEHPIEIFQKLTKLLNFMLIYISLILMRNQ